MRLPCGIASLAFAFFLTVPTSAAEPTDIIVSFVDHWEPNVASGAGPVLEWAQRYAAFANRHRDWDGRPLRHSWFQANTNQSDTPEAMRALTEPILRLCYDGYGEIGIHIHHGEQGTQEENYARFVSQTRAFIEALHRYGIAVTAEERPRTAFGFVHGMWALDNSRDLGGLGTGIPNPQHCGVNRELQALRELGCFADFTFPAWGPMNPIIRDAFFYAQDDDSTGSYRRDGNTRLMSVGGADWGDLLIMSGPSDPWPAVDAAGRLAPESFDEWAAKGVGVGGQNDWVFVKIHCHGYQQSLISQPDSLREGVAALWGDTAERFWSYVESTYNDGVLYRLHYVSAREAYNIAKAGEAGMTGNPFHYRNYVIPEYVHLRMRSSARYALDSWSETEIRFLLVDKPDTMEVRLRMDRAVIAVEESDDGLNWRASNARIDRSGEEIVIRDGSASIYYRVVPGQSQPAQLSGVADTNAPVLTPFHPNPSNASTASSFHVVGRRLGRVDVYDVLGRHVRSLRLEGAASESGTLRWDGHDDRGKAVSSGVYVVRLATGAGVVQRRVTIVR